ncbi:MAG: ComEA family DNA-binding protein [Clostridia bacterium]|nr:ComEA family DNA-binding protein [Clostridia bacterium]
MWYLSRREQIVLAILLTWALAGTAFAAWHQFSARRRSEALAATFGPRAGSGAERGAAAVETIDLAPSDEAGRLPDDRRSAEATGGGEEAGGQVVVHVAGAVARPGVYRLPATARVGDAVTAAGGALPEGRPDVLNLALPLRDGERVAVPTADDVARAGEAGAWADTAAAPKGAVPVDLNRADRAALEGLPGIGPVLAERILAYRRANGPFRSLADLENVPGIGPRLVEGLRGAVVVR